MKTEFVDFAQHPTDATVSSTNQNSKRLETLEESKPTSKNNKQHSTGNKL